MILAALILAQATLTFPTGPAAASQPQVTTTITVPLESAACPYSTVVQSFGNSYGTRLNQVVSTGWNADLSSNTEPVWITSSESNFMPNATTQMSEWHLAWTNAARTKGYRLLSFGVNRLDEKATGYLQADVIGFRGLDNAVYESIDTGTRNHFLYGGMRLVMDVNGAAPLVQRNAAGTAYVDLVRLSTTDEVELAPQGGNVAISGGLHGHQSVSSNHGVALGRATSAVGSASTALGVMSSARLPGQVVQAYGGYAAAGNNQASRVVVSSRIGGAETVLLIGESSPVTLEAGVAYAVSVRVVVTDSADRSRLAVFVGSFAATTAGLNGGTSDVALAAEFSGIAGLSVVARVVGGALNLAVTPPSEGLYLATGLIEWVEVGW